MESRIFRALTLSTLALATLLVVALAQRNRGLVSEFREFRLRTAVLGRGDVVPAFHAVSAAGESVRVGETPPGERQLVFLLTKRCPYCRQTLPIWESLAGAVDTSTAVRVTVLAIALDSLSETEAYVRSHGLHVPVVGFPDRRHARLYRAAAVPQTFVLDHEGNVRYARTGLLTSSAVRDSIVAAALTPATPVASDSTRPPAAAPRER